MFKQKTALALSVVGMIYSASSSAAIFEDYCSESTGYYDCLYSGQTDNELGFKGFVFNNFTGLTIQNESPNADFILKNLSLNTVSDSYEYLGDESVDYYGEVNPLITLITTDALKQTVIDGWQVDIGKPIHEFLHIRDHDYKAGIAMQNSSIKVNADSILNFPDVYPPYEQIPSGELLDMLSVENSYIVNSKQHVRYQHNADPDDPWDTGDEITIGTELGAILSLNGLINMLDPYTVDNVGLGYGFNNSALESETFAKIIIEEGTSDVPTGKNYYQFNFSNSQGKFDNLLSRVGRLYAEQIFIADKVVINIENSTITSGIYSEANGGYRTTDTTLNLTNNSVFNYLGGCTENCNDYKIIENAYSFENTANSYIHAINLSNNSTLAFSPSGRFKHLYIDKLISDGSANIVMNTDLSAMRGDSLYLKEAEGRFNVEVNDQGTEPNINAVLGLITVKQDGASQFLLNQGKGVDIGAYVYDLRKMYYADGQTVWFLDTRTEQETCPSCPPNPGENKPQPPQTSPATDAVLSMGSATQFILNDMLQNLRMQRGDTMRNNTGTGNVWGRFIGSDLRVDGPTNSAYKLQLSGMELGSDKVFKVGNDHLMVGLTGMLTDNKVKHARGGSSDIDAYSVGLYATYLTNSNFFIDGTVKFVNFNTSLNAETTNGSNVTSDYKQYGIGGSLELGYKHLNNSLFIEPYARISYAEVSGKNITLSNDMRAKFDDHKSLLGEVGVSSGLKFMPTENLIVEPYTKVAIEHEFIESNDVLINGQHRFNNDFSGTAGKYGVGINLALGKHTSVYSEVNYLQGRNIEAPIKANVGFRVSF